MMLFFVVLVENCQVSFELFYDRLKYMKDSAQLGWLNFMRSASTTAS